MEPVDRDLVGAVPSGLVRIFGALLLSLQAGTVEAAPDARAPVSWTAPTQCPSPATVAGLVERYVQRPLRNEVVRADATVVREPSGQFAMVLVLLRDDAAPATETLRDRDCSVLAETAALKIATAIDPEATIDVMTEPEPEPDPKPKPEPEPEPDPEPKPEPEPEPEPKPDTSLEPRSCLPGPSALRTGGPLTPACGAVGLRFGVQLGPLPRVGPGVGGHAAILWPRIRLEVGAVHWFQQPARVGDGTSGGDLRLTAGDLVVCGRLGWRRGELDLCPGVELGAMRGIGVGVAQPREDRLLWAAFVGQVRGGWSPLRRLALFAQAGAMIPFARYRFQVGGVGTVHRPALGGFRALLGTEVRFP